MKLIRTLMAAATALAVTAFVAPTLRGADDPGPAAYAQALKGKRVMLVPLAMGFDLAQGWAHYLKKEVEAWGGTFETRDPNWVVDAGAQAITDAISSDTRPDVLIIHAPDLNSYSKLMKKAQAAGIYVILVDNPANFPADAFVGSDWDRLGQLEAEAAIKGCGANSSKKIGLVQGDQANSSSLYQYAGIMKVLDKHPDFKVVAKPDLQLGCDDLAQRDDDDAAAEPRHLRASSTSGTATPPARRPRSATPSCRTRCSWSPPAAARRPPTATSSQDGTYGAVVMTELARQSRRHERDHQVPAAERPAGRHRRRPTSTRWRRRRRRPTSSPTAAGT